MLIKCRVAAAILAIASCGACTDSPRLDILNGVIPAIGYDKQGDLNYGVLPRQKMDIYFPTKPAENSRVVVFVYGGAWRTGERKQYEFVGQALSSAGHTVVIPDYRLYPDTKFPGFVDDIVAAIEKWTQLQNERVGERTLTADGVANIVLMGHSSGAHTASLLASDATWLAAIDVNVSELIAVSGPYDLPLDDDEVAPVFEQAAPSRVQVPKLVTACHPRTLLLHGSADERVAPRHSKTYASALEVMDIDVELVMLEGEGHAKPIAALAAPLQFTSDSYKHVVQFLREPPYISNCTSMAEK